MENNEDKKPKKNLSRHDIVKEKKDECIYEMANGRYMVVVQKRINGKVRTKKKRNIKLMQEAKQCRKKFTYELNQEEMKHRDGQLKWKAAYEKYLNHIQQKIEDSQNSYKPLGQGSLETAKAAYNYTKDWANMFLSQISTHHIERMIRGAEFSGLSYGMKKHYMRHIRSAFKYILGPAASIYLNPAHGIYLPRDKNDEPYKVIWLRTEIMEKVFALLHGPNMEPLSKLSAPIYIHYYTGLRSGEGYAMEWKNIHLDDPENSYMVVRSTFNWRTEKITPTKTGQERTVDVTAIRQYLLAHKLRSPEKTFLFPRDSEWQGGKMARALQSILQQVGYVPDKNHKGEELWPVFHSLRSSYVMNLLTAGVPYLLVQSQTGHSDYKSLKHYIAKLESSETKGISKNLKPFLKSKKTG